MDKKLEWIARLIETEDGTRDPEEFMKALKIDICTTRCLSLRPKRGTSSHCRRAPLSLTSRMPSTRGGQPHDKVPRSTA